MNVYKWAGTVLLALLCMGMDHCSSGRDPAIAAYITSIPKIVPDTPSPAAATGPAGADQDFGIIEKRRHICNATPMAETDVFLEVAALDPNAGTVWPGSVFQGASLKSGRLTPITLPRTAGTVSVINLTKVGTGNVLLSKQVDSPSFESTQQVVQSLTVDPNNLAKSQPADMALSISTVHSFDQALLDVGVSASWMTGNASASLRSAASKHHNALIVKFVQRYYSLKFNNPTSPDSFLDPSVPLDRVKTVAHPKQNELPNDPPMYISEVKFGRMLLIAISSDESSASLETAVRASISSGLGGGSGHLDQSTKNILQSSEIEGLVIGGSQAAGAQLLSTIIGGNIDGLPQFIKDGATYDPNMSPGAPISYTARYLSDDSVADSSFTADFSLTGCRDDEVPITKGRISFQVGNDDKDDEMFPFITITQGGNVVADASGEGRWDNAGHGPTWDDHSFHGPFEFNITGLTMASCSNLTATIGQRSTRGSNPGWRTTAKIELFVNGGWHTAKPMSDNQDEFTWGDNHAGQNSFPLVCP